MTSDADAAAESAVRRTGSAGAISMRRAAAGRLFYRQRDQPGTALRCYRTDSHIVKDAFHRAIVERRRARRQPGAGGHQGLPPLQHTVPAGGPCVLRLRLTPDRLSSPLARTSTPSCAGSACRSDEFYKPIQPAQRVRRTKRRIQRQAFAGMLWTKQIYLFDVNKWMEGDNTGRPPPRVAAADPQCALAAPELDARAVDAGQVGVSVVRRVGSGLPHRAARAIDPSSRRNSSG